jgi:hypothetical protein
MHALPAPPAADPSYPQAFWHRSPQSTLPTTPDPSVLITAAFGFEAASPPKAQQTFMCIRNIGFLRAIELHYLVS